MNTRIPDVYQVSWWPRATQVGGPTPGPRKYKQFHSEAEAARFLDSLPSIKYWTRMGKVKPGVSLKSGECD